MRFVMLSCLALGLLPLGGAQADENAALRSLKRTFYQAVNRHVAEGQRREVETDIDAARERLALRDEEREGPEERERAEKREREASEREVDEREGARRWEERERAFARRIKAAERELAEQRERLHREREEFERQVARHREALERERDERQALHGGRAEHGGQGSGEGQPPHGRDFGFPHEHMGPHGPGPHGMPGPHSGGPPPQHPGPHGLPHVVYVIVAGKPEGGLQPWMGHFGMHMEHGPMAHRHHQEQEDEDDEEEEEIEELHGQVNMLRKEVHELAEILKKLKRDQ